MARIAGVDLPREKRIEISLQYIYGIGKTAAKNICAKAEVTPATRTKDLTDDEVRRIREVIEQTCKVERGDRRDGGTAHDVRENAAAPEAQPVDQRTPEDGHEQPESKRSAHEPCLRGAAGRLEDEPWPCDDRHRVADLRDARGREQRVHGASIRERLCHVRAQAVCASTVIHVPIP